MSTRKTCIITGGNRGIGEFIAREFCKKKYHVLVGARTKTDLFTELGLDIKFKKIDVRNENDHTELVKAAVEWWGTVDVFINNAGFSQWKRIEEINEEFWDKMIDTNLKGTFWGCKAAASVMKSGGTIINISSLAGKRGSANNSIYCASKFGVNGLTQALAKELGNCGIRVNAVCPVYIKTSGLFEALKDNQSPAAGEDIEKYLADFAKSNAALKRLPTGKEVAEICLYFASDKSSGITGQCINVDCGVLPQ